MPEIVKQGASDFFLDAFGAASHDQTRGKVERIDE
jgi:hypothetical protein